MPALPVKARPAHGDPGLLVPGGGLPEPVSRPRPGSRPRDGDRSAPHRLAPGNGRCEVVVFSPAARRVVRGPGPGSRGHCRGRVGGYRTAELPPPPASSRSTASRTAGTRTRRDALHPHGQIYAYPFITPRTSRMLGAVRAYRDRTGRDLVEDTLAAERADGSRIVVAGRPGPPSSRSRRAGRMRSTCTPRAGYRT